MTNSKILSPIGELKARFKAVRRGALSPLRRAPHARWVALIIAVVLSAPFVASSEASTTASLTFAKQTPVGIVGLPLKVDINIANGTNVIGWGTEVVFDPAKLQFASGTFSTTWLQSGGRTAICLGPGDLFIPASSQTTAPLAPGITTIDVNNIGPFTAGKAALIEWDAILPSDAGGSMLDQGGAPLLTGSGPLVTYASASMTDTGKSWTSGQWTGKVVRSGARFATISGNTANTLSLSPGWSPSTPAAGDQYDIVPAILYSSGAPQLTDPTKTWVLNEWMGKVVRVGDNFATITANTATTLTLSPGWSPAIPTKGSPYNIVPAITYTNNSLMHPGKTWGVNQWKGAFVSSGAKIGTVLSNTSNTLTLTANWNALPAPIKGDAYAVDFGPPETISEGVGVVSKNPNTPLDGYPGTLTVTRGQQLRGGAPVLGSGVTVTYGTSSVTDTSQTWVPNQFIGAQIVSGTKSGTIASNTPTQMTLTAPWTGGTPASQATFKVTETFPSGSDMRIPNPSRKSVGCGTNWFTENPPAGASGGGKLASLTFTPLATTAVGANTPIDFSSTTVSKCTPEIGNPTVCSGGSLHLFTTTGTTVQIIACPVLDGSAPIGFGEFLKLLAAWGSHGPPGASSNWNAAIDLDKSNSVGFNDFLILLGYWGMACPP